MDEKYTVRCCWARLCVCVLSESSGFSPVCVWEGHIFEAGVMRARALRSGASSCGSSGNWTGRPLETPEDEKYMVSIVGRGRGGGGGGCCGGLILAAVVELSSSAVLQSLCERWQQQ